MILATCRTRQRRAITRAHLLPSSLRIRVAKAYTTAPHPQVWGSIWKIESQANNWKPDRFAGANGVLFARCTKLTETITLRGREGPPLPRTLLKSSCPCLPRQSRVAAVSPEDPVLSFTSSCPQWQRPPPKGPEVAPEITRQCFLHPFLIAAGCNDALWKINT